MSLQNPKGKTSLVFALLCFCILLSCGRAVKTETEASADSVNVDGEIDYDKLFLLETYLTDGTIAEAELQSIDSSCAIIVFPTEDQFEEIKKTEGEDNFDTIVDDGNFYQATAMELLDSVGVKTVTANKRYLRITGLKTWTLDIRKKHLPEWNLIFFNMGKEPMIVPAAGLEKQKIADYFQPPK